MKKKDKLLKGWKIWKKVSDAELNPVSSGSYMIIATNKDIVGLFFFDGIEKIPTHIFQYRIINPL